MNVGNASVKSRGVLVSKHSRKRSIGNAKLHAIEKNVDSCLIESKSPTLVRNGEGKKQITQEATHVRSPISTTIRSSTGSTCTI